jgi:hypothetical protein
MGLSLKTMMAALSEDVKPGASCIHMLMQLMHIARNNMQMLQLRSRGWGGVGGKQQQHWSVTGQRAAVGNCDNERCCSSFQQMLHQEDEENGTEELLAGHTGERRWY